MTFKKLRWKEKSQKRTNWVFKTSPIRQNITWVVSWHHSPYHKIINQTLSGRQSKAVNLMWQHFSKLSSGEKRGTPLIHFLNPQDTGFSSSNTNAISYQNSHQFSLKLFAFKKLCCGASLVAQWLRICLLMQGTRVRALVWEDPTCHGAAGPVSHGYWACASGACAPQREGPR